MKYLVLFFIFIVSGCNTMPYYAPTYSSGSYYTAPQSKKMIFGGENNNTYLGCISCNEYVSDSVFNSYGDYGSSYSQTSIFNSYSQYGSAYSNYSPCNRYANNPPVIVDSAGNFYGYLTLNQYFSNATKDGNILAWLAGVCAGR